MIQAPQERRLTDQLLKAFHQACDNGDAESAERLLAMVDTLNARTRPLGLKDRRQSRMDLRGARERLQALRSAPAAPTAAASAATSANVTPDAAPGAEPQAKTEPSAALNTAVEPN